MTSDEDSESSLKGYDPVNSKWVTVYRNKRNSKRDSKHDFGVQCNLKELEIVNTNSRNIVKEPAQISESIQEYMEQLKRATEVQADVGKAIKDGQKLLEKVVQSQQRMIESMMKKHNDSQVSCIAQVAGLCNSVVDVTEAKLESMTNEMAKLSANVSDLSAQVGHLYESSRQLSETPSKRQQHQTVGSPSSSLRQTGPDERHSSEHRQIANILDEYLDIERRKKNVVVCNLPEPSWETNSERMKDDLKSFIRIVREELHLIISAEKCFRAGKRHGTGPRLLIVTLDTEDMKREVLRQAPQLRNSTRFPGIYINPDLSPQQRIKAKLLREELAQRRARGEQNIRIQRGQIVRTEPTLANTPQLLATAHTDEHSGVSPSQSRSGPQDQQAPATTDSQGHGSPDATRLHGPATSPSVQHHHQNA